MENLPTKGKNKLGTENIELGNIFLNQVVGTCIPPRNQQNIKEVATLVSLFDECKVQSPIETMLLSQMAAVHTHLMKSLALANSDCSMSTKETIYCMANKLLKTFTTQVEVYEKFKRGGHQSIKVDHVHVHNGAQAIVGNVNHENRGALL